MKLKPHLILNDKHYFLIYDKLVAPKVFNLIFNVIKPLLNSTTLGKVSISSNEKDWKPALFNLIDEDQLCTRLGGTRPSRVPVRI